MSLSDRNKKVANNRWSKRIEQENNNIKTDNKSMLFRAAICGFLAGDGSVQVRKQRSHYRYDIYFFPDDEKMLQAYLDMIKYIYNKNPAVKRKTKFYSVRITSVAIAKDILKYSTFGIKTWTIPGYLESVKGAKEEWLKAFFSAEGYVSKNTIRIQTVNKLGISQISHLLDTLNINHRCFKYTPKKENHSEVAILIIIRKSDRHKFYDQIGFYHNKKEILLRKTLDL